MTKQEHIQYWKNMAERDWLAVNSLFETKNYVQALFFGHLVIEKLLKAVWVKDNVENTPPLAHNLEYLYNQTNLEFPANLADELGIINSWNIEGRYQDYKDKFYKKCTREYTSEKIKSTNELRLCLLNELP